MVNPVLEGTLYKTVVITITSTTVETSPPNVSAQGRSLKTENIAR